MEIIKATPQGFCKGVIRAVNMTKKALFDSNTIRPIYILGNIVHNKNISNAFSKMGLIKINEDDIENINNGTIIFTAHGVSPIIYNKVLEKGLNIIDATCPKVNEIHNLIKEKINEGYQIAFFGKENHSETKGVLGISKDIVLVNDNLEIKDIKDKCLLVCQTTLSFPNLANSYKILKNKYPNLIIYNQICNATLNRQKAGIKASKDVDLSLVVGDKMSNNCNTLAKTITEVTKVKSILVEDLNDIKKIDFTNIKKISLTSGASTPKVLVERIEEYLLKGIEKEIKDEEYIKL